MKTLVILFAPFLLALAPAVCQDQEGIAPKKELRPFQAPQLRVVDPIVASDEGCARDFAKALKLDGLEQRKYLLDLFQYGCVERLNGPYYANILSLVQFGEGAAKVEMRKVYLIPVSGTTKEHTGWIAAKELIDIALIQRALDALRALQKSTEVK
jgi:hypothetical protein